MMAMLWAQEIMNQETVEDAKKMAATGFVSALVAGAIFGLVGLIFLDGLVGILGATPTIAPYARQYAMYILIGTPFMASSLVLNNQLRFQGSAFFGMIGMGVEKAFKLNKNLEALTEVDVIYFDVRPIMKELPNSIEFLRVYVKKLEESYAQMWEAREIMRESAQARYTWFQKTYPNLQNVMQMKDVATFLGITPVTLSRIRAKENSSVKKDSTT